MTREDANKLFIKILRECVAEKERIRADAEKGGLIKPGLDGNRDLFTKIDKKYWARVQNLAEQIDD